jgi:DNA-binding response OmpR family regulator
MQVLLVEDHTDTRAVLSVLLNRCGCRTVTAKNLREARTRLKEMRFEILICDLNLPDGDGLELAGEAKKLQPLKAIALTGRDSEQERVAGINAGFDCYLTKPIEFRELQEALKRSRNPADVSESSQGRMSS